MCTRVLVAVGSTGGSVVNSLPASAGDVTSRPRVGKTPWRRKWQPLQYPCLEHPTDGGAWRAAVHAAAQELDLI